MGFLSKIRNNMRKEISRMPRRPGMMRDMGPGNMPRRPDISDIFGRGSFLFGRRPRGNMGSDFRMPQIGGILREGKKRRFGFGLGEAIRRLKKQRDMGMPRRPSMDFGDQIGYKRPNKNPDAIAFDNPSFAFDNPSFRMIGTPQPISERMPINRFKDPIKRNAPSFNPTIFGQPIGDMDFSQMPKISPEDMMNLQVPTDMPMTQDLPEVAPVGMMPQMRMDDMQDMEPRMMMQEGEDVSLERELFSLQAQLKNLEEQLRLDRSYNDDQAVIDTSAKMASIQKRIQEIMNSRPQLEGGGDFPDLTGDGKVTQADILKGRGVQLKANGGEMMMEETEMMAPSGDEIEASLMEVQGMQPEIQALDQFVQMVIEMVQAGASEAEVIESLRQAGLDDDDIAAVFQAVMETMQGSMEQGGIDAELAQLS